MSVRRSWVGTLAGAALFGCFIFRAVSVHSTGPLPEIHRVLVENNDLNVVEGIAPPGADVELWYRQRNFKEGGGPGSDNFKWCGWKNDGDPIMLGIATTNAEGTWRLGGLRASTTVMLFPAAPAGNACSGGILTELLPRICDGDDCTDWAPPHLRWLNVRRTGGGDVGTAAGSIEDAIYTSISVADGPNDGPEPSTVYDSDQNGIDTTRPGLTPGQRVTWKCGSGGTAVCPSVAIWDATTVLEPDPEFPFLLGTLQGHAPGGSIFAAAAIDRGSDLGFAVNVNVKFRGSLDINFGCDRAKFFDFSVPLDFPF